MSTRLDGWMPRFDVRAAYATVVAAPVEGVFAALFEIDFSRQPLVAVLMGLRAIPALLLSPSASWRRLRTPRPRRTGRLKSLLGSDFVLLEEAPSEELVIGITGRFWMPSGGLVATDPSTFRDPPPAGMARAAWNFQLEELDGGRTRLTTETRVRCADAATARRFRAYLAGRGAWQRAHPLGDSAPSAAAGRADGIDRQYP